MEPTPHDPTAARMETWSRELDLRSLAERFGTPLYVHHLDRLRENLARWVGLVGDPSRVRYPVKANPSPVVMSTLAKAGVGADCASPVEVRLALGHGVPVEAVTYNTPAFDARLAAWLLSVGGTVVVDSAQALAELVEIVDPTGVDGRLAVRVNPGGLPGYREASEVQRYTDHGASTSQFGVPSEDVARLVEGYPLPITGLHMHVGTQMDNVDTFVEGLGFLHDLADVLAAKAGLKIDVLDLGGGLGIPFADDQRFPSTETLVSELRPWLRKSLEYHVEPGNALVGDAVALVARVVVVKESRGKRWAILDVGTDQLVKHTVARWEHQILRSDGRPFPRVGPDGVAGPLCFAGDLLLPETVLPAELAPGDPVVVQHAGAYCEAVSSHFNGRRAPAHVAIDGGGEPRLVHRREDVFFQPGEQAFLPGALRTIGGAADGESIDREALVGEVLAPEQVRALQSQYMHTLANADVYELREVRRVGRRAYEVSFDLRAAVDFVAMPFALRLVGDATIVAVGVEMGWTTKAGPVWATRLSMTCGEILPVDGVVVCRIELGALAPSPSPDTLAVAVAHYDLGGGASRGVAHVVVPALPVAVPEEDVELAATS